MVQTAVGALRLDEHATVNGLKRINGMMPLAGPIWFAGNLRRSLQSFRLRYGQLRKGTDAHRPRKARPWLALCAPLITLFPRVA
jgi:hypothetical protein